MEASQTEIIAFIEGGNLAQLIPAIECALQHHRTLPTTTLFRTSIRSLQLDVLQYLLDRFVPGDDDNERSGNGKNAPLKLLDRAVILEALEPNRVSAFKLLCSHNPSLQTMNLGHLGAPLAWAILGNNIPLASYLLANGVDPNQSQIQHRPLIVAAASRCSCEMMELLLKHGAIIGGTDAIFAAVRNQRIDMLTLLLKTRKVADINAIQPVYHERDLTPGPVLHLAIRRKYKEMVHVLIDQFYADPLAQDMEGRTAISWAEVAKDPEVLKKCLLENK